MSTTSATKVKATKRARSNTNGKEEDQEEEETLPFTERNSDEIAAAKVKATREKEEKGLSPPATPQRIARDGVNRSSYVKYIE